jgi:hypothetical protein
LAEVFSDAFFIFANKYFFSKLITEVEIKKSLKIGVIRRRKSKKDRKYNGHKKKNKSYIYIELTKLFEYRYEVLLCKRKLLDIHNFILNFGLLIRYNCPYNGLGRSTFILVISEKGYGCK